MTVADYVAAVTKSGCDKHGQIVAFLKSDHGLTHGNANLIAQTVRQQIAGGPPSADELLSAQYAKGKAVLRPIYDRLVDIACEFGPDVEIVIQKTGVSLRRAKQFALIQAPSASRVQLGLNLDATPVGGRVEPMAGMCTHRTNLTSVDDVDNEVVAWLSTAYESAG